MGKQQKNSSNKLIDVLVSALQNRLDWKQLTQWKSEGGGEELGELELSSMTSALFSQPIRVEHAGHCLVQNWTIGPSSSVLSTQAVITWQLWGTSVLPQLVLDYRYLAAGKIDQTFPVELQQVWGEPESDHPDEHGCLTKKAMRTCAHAYIHITIEYCRIHPHHVCPGAHKRGPTSLPLDILNFLRYLFAVGRSHY